jgi:hypothetical protein
VVEGLITALNALPKVIKMITAVPDTTNTAAQQKQGGDTKTGPPAVRLTRDPQLD